MSGNCQGILIIPDSSPVTECIHYHPINVLGAVVNHMESKSAFYVELKVIVKGFDFIKLK